MEINTMQSPYAILKTIPLKNVSLKDGLWSCLQATDHEINSDFQVVELFRESSQPRYLALAAFLLTNPVGER